MSRVLPIIFNTDMVRSILDEQKTVTRRLIKPQPKSKLAYCFAGYGHGTWGYPPMGAWKYWNDESFQLPDKMTEEELSKRWKPPCQADDILYVRETWAFIPCIGCDGRYNRGQAMNCYDLQAVEYDDGNSISDGCFVYRSDCSYPEKVSWRPSIHMPKQAARIWLKATNVYVDWLQNMSLDDFLKEGVILRPESFNDPENAYQEAKTEFRHIWNSTIKKQDLEMYGFDANPCTWVIEFGRCEKPDEDKCQR